MFRLKRSTIDKFFSQFLFILFTSFLCLIPAYFVYRFFLLFLQDSFILFIIILGFFYFIPTIFCTILFLNKWSKHSKFIFTSMFTITGKLVPFDRCFFKFLIDSVTLVSTFIILISTPLDLKAFDSPIDSLLIAVYPVNLGFIIWEYYNSPNKNLNKYHPKRKFK